MEPQQACIGGQLDGQGVIVFERPRQCSAQIVELGHEAREALLVSTAPMPVRVMVVRQHPSHDARVTFEHRVGFAGFAQLLERVRARRLEQPQPGMLAVFSEHHGLVDQRAEMIERCPGINHQIGRDILRAPDLEAAGKDTDPAKHGLLLDRQ